MAQLVARVNRGSMRIAVVTETYPPEVNGVANSLARMVEGLRDRGHGIQLLRPRQQGDDLPSWSPHFDEVLLGGMAIPRYPHLRMGLPCTSTLKQLWSQRRPDVVHVATEGPLGWSAVRAATQLHLPVVSDFRTNFHAYSRHYGLGWMHRPICAYLKSFHNRTDCTMVPTPALRGELRSLGFANLQVVARGVDTTRFNPTRRSESLRESWGAKSQTLVVQCVSRLAPEKNISLVWQAFSAIRATGVDAQLVLVGDGPLRAALERQCAGAHFVGVRRGDDLASHYASADLFLFPSETETFGNVVPEAMASGLAVVAFDLAAAGQLIRSGENGLLAVPAAPRNFIDLAGGLASKPQLLQAIRLEARRSALTLDWQRVIEDLESVLVRAALGRSLDQPEILLRPAGT